MQTDTRHQVYAGFFVRLAAFLVDMIIVNAGLMIVNVPMWILSLSSPNNILVRDFIFQYSVLDIVKYLLTVLYFVLFTYYSGSTLGKKLFQIRVVSVQERKMTLFEVIYRESIGRFLCSVIMQLGYLLVIVQKEHRGVHDLLSDTCVIYYHEKKVYVHTQMNYRNMAPSPGFTVPPGATGNGSLPPNMPGNAPAGMQGNAMPDMPGNAPADMQGNSIPMPDQSDKGQTGESVSVSIKKDGKASQNPEEEKVSASETDSRPDFVRAEEEPEHREVPFEGNE